MSQPCTKEQLDIFRKLTEVFARTVSPSVQLSIYTGRAERVGMYTNIELRGILPTNDVLTAFGIDPVTQKQITSVESET